MNSKQQVWTVLKMLEWATGYFEERGIPDARLSIEWIVADVLKKNRLDLYLQFDRPFSDEELEQIRPMVKRRAAHEPLQYITGSTQFYGLDISVSPGVLIPRQETEQLVDLIIQDLANLGKKSLNLLDIGTGSGCIPIAIKNQYPAWKCTGIDISAKALEIAKKNALANQTEVDFFLADINNWKTDQRLQKLSCDIIISNPPYITHSEKSELDKQVLEHEPGIALFHESPLSLYKQIVQYAAAEQASLYLECNDKTADDVSSIANSFFEEVEVKKDLDGNDRFVIAEKPM